MSDDTNDDEPTDFEKDVQEAKRQLEEAVDGLPLRESRANVRTQMFDERAFLTVTLNRDEEVEPDYGDADFLFDLSEGGHAP